MIESLIERLINGLIDSLIDCNSLPSMEHIQAPRLQASRFAASVSGSSQASREKPLARKAARETGRLPSPLGFQRPPARLWRAISVHRVGYENAGAKQP